MHWHGETTGGGVHAVCRKDPTYPIVLGTPDSGCAFWDPDPRKDPVAYADRWYG